jgi:hypothetical protein
MAVDVELNGQAGTSRTASFADAELPAGRYCYHVAAGGALVVLVEERGESRVELVYGPTAWQCASGDVWRKGALLT